MKKIVAWGADKTFEIAMKTHPLRIAYLVDNNPKKHGTRFQGVPVKHPSVIKRGERIMVFVFSFPEIKEQLETMGFVYKKDFFHFLDFPEYRSTIDEIVSDKDYHFLEKIIKPGWHCVDVGANCGFFTYKMSLLAGDQGMVYSFEPLLHAYDQLLRFKETYELNNVVPFNVALSDKEGDVTMEIPLVSGRPISVHAHIKGERGKIDSENLKKLFKDYVETGTEVVKAKANTLDTVLGDIPRIDFIKIDVEGAELLVLKGARAAITKHKPLIQCELLWGNRDNVIAYLQKFGYECWVLSSIELVSYNKLRDKEKEYNFYFSIPT